jgi:hypothetical protein
MVEALITNFSADQTEAELGEATEQLAFFERAHNRTTLLRQER